MWVATRTSGTDVSIDCPYCHNEMREVDESPIYEDGAYYLYWQCLNLECKGHLSRRVMKFQLVVNRVMGADEEVDF